MKYPTQETRFDELKRYVRFADADAEALLAFRPIAAPHFTRIAREFYERIREHQEAHDVFSGEEQIERLQRSMVRWMDRLLSGVYDEAYREQTLAIGRMHVRVGLPQRYMFTAMALIRVAFEEVAANELGDAAPKTRTALTRLLDMELAIMVESYREDLAEKARRRDEVEAQSLRTDLARALRLYEAAICTRLRSMPRRVSSWGSTEKARSGSSTDVPRISPDTRSTTCSERRSSTRSCRTTCARRTSRS
jgi:truncated hemoglobin YjbI